MAEKPFVLRLQPEMLKALENGQLMIFAASMVGQIEYLLQKALLDSGRSKQKKNGWEKSSIFFAKVQSESGKEIKTQCSFIQTNFPAAD